MEAVRAGEAYLLADQSIERNVGSAADAHRHNHPARLDDREHVPKRDTNPGAFEACVEIAFVGGIEQGEPIRFAAGIHGRRGSHFDCGCQRCVSEIDGDDFLSTRELRRTHEQGSNRSCAHDQDALAEHAARIVDGVQADGERLGAGGFFQPDITNRFAPKILDDDLVAKTAVAMRLAHRASEKLHLKAMLLLSDLAEAAMAAGEAGAKCDAASRFDVRDLAADGLDCAGDFVAQDDGFADLDRSDAAIPEVMDVRAAEAAGTNAHTDLFGTDIADLARFNAHIALPMEHAGPGLHGQSSLSLYWLHHLHGVSQLRRSYTGVKKSGCCVSIDGRSSMISRKCSRILLSASSGEADSIASTMAVC